jgi:hypothetical protein
MSQLQSNQANAQAEYDRIAIKARSELDTINADLALANSVKAAMADVYGDLLSAITRHGSDADAVLQHIDPIFYTQLTEVSYRGIRKIDGIKAIRNRYGYGLGDSKMFIEALKFNIF